MEDLIIGEKFVKPRRVRPAREVNGTYTTFTNGDVLLAKITPCFENGKVAIATALTNGIGFGSSEYIVFRPNAGLDEEYLYYYLSQPSFRTKGAQQMRGAVGHKRIPKDFITSYPIPIPPLSEQKRIVGILDKAFEFIAAVRANTRKNAHNARDLFESELGAIFSHGGADWEIAPIEQHVRFIDYRGKTPKKTAAGLRLITAKNVRMGFVRDEPTEFVSPATYDAWMTRGIPQIGDVLFTTEAPLANVAQLDIEGRVVFAQRIIIMQANSSTIDNTFLKYALMSNPLQRRIHELGTGTTAKGIKASVLKKIPIAFPRSMHKQRMLVGRFDELRRHTDTLTSLYARKLKSLEELEKSILHAAFNGEL